MAEYNKYVINSSDIKDELIAPIVKAADKTLPDLTVDNEFLNEMTEYVKDLIYSVAGIEIDDLPDPVPYKLKELAKVFVCKEVCLRKSFSGSQSFRNSTQVDVSDRWAQKLSYYQKLVNNYETSITPELLQGNQPIGIMGVLLERG